MKKIFIISLLFVSILITSGCSYSKNTDESKSNNKEVLNSSTNEKQNPQNDEDKNNKQESNKQSESDKKDNVNKQNNEEKLTSEDQSKVSDKIAQYKNERYLFSIDYPSDYKVEQTSANGDGAVLSSGNAKISVFGSNNISDYNVNSYFDQVSKEVKGEIKNKSVTNNSFSITYESGESVIYGKYVVGSGSINAFVFTYPKAQSKEYEKVIEKLNSSFKTPGISEAH